MAELTNKQILDRLYGWSAELELKDTKGETFTKVYQRVIGDAALEDSRKKALIASRKLRLSLKDKTSEDYFIHIAPLLDLTRDEKLVTLTNAKYSQFRTLAFSSVEKTTLPELESEATQEEQEEHLAKEKELNDSYYDEVFKKVNELVAKFKVDSEAKSDDAINQELIAATIESMCQDRMVSVFHEMCAYQGTFKDKNFSKQAFTLDEFYNLLSYIKVQVVEGYMSLELGADDLKN